MKTILHQSEYYVFTFISETNLLEVTSLPASDKMREEDIQVFLKVFQSILSGIEKVEYLFDNQKNRGWVIDVETQDWIAQNLVPIAMMKGLKKMAHIPPTEFIANISSEQMMEEAENQAMQEEEPPFAIKFFNNAEEAKKWLNV